MVIYDTENHKGHTEITEKQSTFEMKDKFLNVPAQMWLRRYLNVLYPHCVITRIKMKIKGLLLLINIAWMT